MEYIHLTPKYTVVERRFLKTVMTTKYEGKDYILTPDMYKFIFSLDVMTFEEKLNACVTHAKWLIKEALKKY